MSLVYCIIGGRGGSGPDRERKPERDCLGISVISGIPPLRFGEWSVWCRHVLGRICGSWYIELSGPGGKAAPFENGNWGETVWKFQLSQGPRPLRFGAWSVWCGDLIGRVCVPDILHYWGAEAKRPRSRTATGTRLSGDFSYFRDPAPLGLGRGPFPVGIY